MGGTGGDEFLPLLGVDRLSGVNVFGHESFEPVAVFGGMGAQREVHIANLLPRGQQRGLVSRRLAQGKCPSGQVRQLGIDVHELSG